MSSGRRVSRVGDLYMYWDSKEGQHIVVLLEIIGDLTVGGNLSLNNANLESLPESFESLTVGRDLGFNGNKLESLPASFGSLTVVQHDFPGDFWS